MPVTIAALGADGPPAKRSKGRYRFLCPHCREMLATVNPRNNLAHCFGCKKSLNNIDLLLTLGYDFKSAVSILVRMYEHHRARLPCADSSLQANPTSVFETIQYHVPGNRQVSRYFGLIVNL